MADEARGGIKEWYYDLDVTGVQQQSNGSVLRLNLLQGCNPERKYVATGWSFDNKSDTIKVEFQGNWEKYALVEVDDPDRPRRGRFAYDSSVDVQMTGTWELGSRAMYCTIGYRYTGGGGATTSNAYCDCLHCPVTSCGQSSCCGTPLQFSAE